MNHALRSCWLVLVGGVCKHSLGASTVEYTGDYGLATATSVIKAIHDTDLVKVLRKLGLYGKLVSGDLRCVICGCSLTLDNLGGLYRENSEVKLVCNRIECLVEAAERVKHRREQREASRVGTPGERL